MIFRGAWNKYCYSLSWCNEKSSSFIKIVDLDTEFFLFLFFWIGGVLHFHCFQHVEVLVCWCLPIQWGRGGMKQSRMKTKWEWERDREEERERGGLPSFYISMFCFCIDQFFKKRRELGLASTPLLFYQIESLYWQY